MINIFERKKIPNIIKDKLQLRTDCISVVEDIANLLETDGVLHSISQVPLNFVSRIIPRMQAAKKGNWDVDYCKMVAYLVHNVLTREEVKEFIEGKL